MKTTKSNGNGLSTSEQLVNRVNAASLKGAVDDSVTEIVPAGQFAERLHLAPGASTSVMELEKALLDSKSKLANDKIRNGERRPVADEIYRGSIKKGLLHFEGVEVSPHLELEFKFLKAAGAFHAAYRALLRK